MSGGGDSLALLHLLNERDGIDLVALTVDHGLREGAKAEVALVRAVCRRIGIEHHVLTWTWDGEGNLPEAARNGRYGVMAAWCAANGVRDCMLGHTRGDNVETFIMGLMRGAGLDGLSGMRPYFTEDGVWFHRPLLAASRRDLREVLASRGEPWAEDPTNEDIAYDRARIRQLLFELDVPEEHLARSVSNLAATRRDISQELVTRLRHGLAKGEGPDILFDHTAFTELSAEFRRRCFGAAIRALTGAEHAPRADALLRLVERDWATDPGPTTLKGCTIGLWPGGLRIGRELSALPQPVPSTEVWDGRWRFSGPHGEDTRIGALGAEGLRHLAPSWKTQTEIPRASMMTAPGVWRGEALVYTPFAEIADEAVAERWSSEPADAAQVVMPAFRAAILSH